MWRRVVPFLPRGFSAEQAEEIQEAIEANPDVDVFDNQNAAMIGLSIVAQAGLVGSFVAMSAAQKLQQAIRTAKSSIRESSPKETHKDLESKSTLHEAKKYEIPKSKANILVCTNGEEANLWKLNLIKAANRTIEISGNFCGGAVFREALIIMRDKLQENDKLQIHILCSPELIQSADLSLVSDIEKQFPENFHFLLTKTICSHVFRSGEKGKLLESRENHVKLVVVDDYYFVAGGTNFEEHLGTKGEEDQSIGITASLYERFVLTASRDMDVVGAGDIACVLRARFFDLFANWLNVMNRKYIGETFMLKKRTKTEIMEENRVLKQQIAELEEENLLLQYKLQEIKNRILCGASLDNLLKDFSQEDEKEKIESPEVNERDEAEIEEWCMVDPNWELNSSTFNAAQSQRAFIQELEISDLNPRLILDVSIEGVVSSLIYDNNSEMKYESKCTNEYIRAIDSATTSLRLCHLNVNPAPQLMASILNAVKRGVRLELITTAADSTTPLAAHFYAWANRVNYLPIMTGEAYLENSEQAKEFLRDNVTIYEYGVSRTTYHKKVLVVDDTIFLIGSYNMSQKSHHGDDELLLSINSPEVCKQVNEILDIDKAKSNEITSSQAEQYYFSWKARFLSDFQRGRVAKLVG